MGLWMWKKPWRCSWRHLLVPQDEVRQHQQRYAVEKKVEPRQADLGPGNAHAAIDVLEDGEGRHVWQDRSDVSQNGRQRFQGVGHRAVLARITDPEQVLRHGARAARRQRVAEGLD